MDKGKLDYSLSSTGLLIDIRDMDLVSGDETAEEQKLNPCGCDVGCTCRTEQNHTEQIRQQRQNHPTFRSQFSIHIYCNSHFETVKQCTSEMQHFVLSLKCKTTNCTTEGLCVLDFLARHYKTDVVNSLTAMEIAGATPTPQQN